MGGVNKMDSKSCNYSEDRYNEIQGEVDKMLTKIGYKTKKIPFIPMSGFLGVNLTSKGDKLRDEKMPWYKGWSVKIKKNTIEGKTLYDALELVAKPPKRDKKKPWLPTRLSDSPQVEKKERRTKMRCPPNKLS